MKRISLFIFAMVILTGFKGHFADKKYQDKKREIRELNTADRSCEQDCSHKKNPKKCWNKCMDRRDGKSGWFNW